MGRVSEIATLAANDINEDRAGAVGALAWVIDGATDVIDTPLTTSATDANWIAETLDGLIAGLAVAPPADLAELPAILTERLQLEFRRAAKRRPIGRHEHPSAAALIVRADGLQLDYLSIGDCTLLALSNAGVTRLGTKEDEAGDMWVAEALMDYRSKNPDAPADAAHAQLWPQLGAARWSMNQLDGYGVFSLTPTPSRFIKLGSLKVAPGGHALLATDGLMRLVDVFRRYSIEELLAETIERGIAALATEVRALELDDPDCIQFPRAKRHDDASGVLLSF